jgi:hypothetical protein
MKRIGFVAMILFSSLFIRAQESQVVEKMSPSLRLFLQEYYGYLFNIIEMDTTDVNILLGDGFFLKNTPNDTLHWPRIVEEGDKLYKSKIGPLGLNIDVDRLAGQYKKEYSYSGFELKNFDIKEVYENKLFTKYKILADQQFKFTRLSDASNLVVNKPLYYEIVNYFDPKSMMMGGGTQNTGYLYRINTINEKQKYGRFSPQYVGLNNRIGMLQVTENSLYHVKDFLNLSSRIEADWLLGGKGYNQFLFTTGIGYGINWFSLTSDQFTLSFPELKMKDKDNFPFELIANGQNISQKISYNTIELPVLLKFERFFRNKNFNISVSGGANIQMVNNFSLKQSSGTYEFQGKYKFTNFNEPVVLYDLPDYNYKVFNYGDPALSGLALSVNKFLVSAEFGLTGRYYFSKNLTANAGFSYIKSILPLYNNTDTRISFDIQRDPDNPENIGFQPEANPLFVANAKTKVDTWGFNFGISYYLSKPLIPFTKQGLNNAKISKMVKSVSVLPGLKETGKPATKEVNFIIRQDEGDYQDFRYSYIGPETQYFQQGKLHSGKAKDNKLSFLVPASNNAKLFIEEPYGYELNMGVLPSQEIGEFKQIKAIDVSDIWESDKFIAKYDFSMKELTPFDIHLLYYDRGREDEINTGVNAFTNYFKNINLKSKNIFYVVTTSPFCTDSLEEIGFRLFDSKEIPYDPNIEFLKDFLKEKQLNARRKINFKIILPYSGFDRLSRLISQLPVILQIDYNKINFEVTGYQDVGYINQTELTSIISELLKKGIKVNKL